MNDPDEVISLAVVTIDGKRRRIQGIITMPRAQAAKRAAAAVEKLLGEGKTVAIEPYKGVRRGPRT